MARPPVYDDALRSRLLEATAELVDRVGPERVTLRDAARAAGTSTSAVYAFFGGRDELLGAVVAEAFTSFAAEQSRAEGEGLRSLGYAYRDWAKRHPARYRLMFGGALASFDGGIDSDRSLEPLMRALAARGATDPLAAAVSVWAHVHGAVSLEFACVAPPEADWDAVYETVLDDVERAWPRA